MVFVLLTDEQTLMVYPTEAAAISACEGIDVEDGEYRFFNAAGHPLLPVFDEPNSRTRLLVRSGRYHLRLAEDARDDLLSLLPSIPRIEPSTALKSADDVERFVKARRAIKN
jgi:hypothetical protein